MELLSYLKYLKLGVYFVLLLGISSHFLIWFSGFFEKLEGGLKGFLKGIFLRIPFQTGIVRLGVLRWIAHFFIFISFLWFLFFYWFPSVLKFFSFNQRALFFLHDLFSALFISGIFIAIFRRFFSRKDTRGEFEDFYSISMLLGVWLSGFLLQVSKIQSIDDVARRPEFFIGSSMAGLFDNLAINLPFVPLLYIHVIIVLIFVASIPWTKLVHIFTLPIKELFGGRNG